MFQWLKDKVLFGAIQSGDITAFTEALQRGANPNSYFRGQTPLIWACMRGEQFMIMKLIECGADPYQKDKSMKYNAFDMCKKQEEHGVINEGLYDTMMQAIEMYQVRKDLIGKEPIPEWLEYHNYYGKNKIG
tara:strand:- start:788 stop:1183 length:396 start_codon:yes stop_codon:yes gene_type:complete